MPPPCFPRPLQPVSPDIARSARCAGSADQEAHRACAGAGQQVRVPARPDLRESRSASSVFALRWRDRRIAPSLCKRRWEDKAWSPCVLRSPHDSATCPVPAPRVFSRSLPSPLIFALPLSKNVPVADSVSSMRKPSFVTVMSMWLSNLSNLETSRIDFCSCSFTPADKFRSLVAMSSERPKLFLLTLGTLETNGRRAKRG